ncbi:MAG: cupredoxin domain-containing protein [Burkholderiaceae bacterium]|nr:cupredoxin domain-containing protein [Burkholderiaceae bacterium]
MRAHHRSRRHALQVGLLGLCALPGAEAAGPGLPAIVRIHGHRFEPATLSIAAGSTVRWINDEKRSSHSVRFAAEGGLESERLLPGEHWERRFDQPGRYAYDCGPHPEMRGLIEVLP